MERPVFIYFIGPAVGVGISAFVFFQSLPVLKFSNDFASAQERSLFKKKEGRALTLRASISNKILGGASKHVLNQIRALHFYFSSPRMSAKKILLYALYQFSDFVFWRRGAMQSVWNLLLTGCQALRSEVRWKAIQSHRWISGKSY